ncbi:hypothetical protein SGFS_005710 [Streptomyces graminofaciens]|uniref:Uncharacterized protein n=1 Tax=Streptomyces graminofaciens TaxID=68212 RepID=A0ABM7F0Q4_9ACTN|nr:acyltransferase [Streptomyces graminofaciens]BBC29277.1 hypothetical protein SGFS_005710 [Streptomyces graminofaciens]
MSGSPRPDGSGTYTGAVRAGHASGKVVRCALADLRVVESSVSVLFYFDRALDEAPLREGLARALAHVPAFAGRLRRRDDALEIVCDDSGATMTTADSGLDLAQAVAEAAVAETDLVERMDPSAAWSGGDPLLKVRLTRLSDGGTALGCTWHHAVGDIRSLMTLMRAWSASVEGSTPPEALVVEDREGYLDDVLPPTGSRQPGYRLLPPADVEQQWAAAYRALQESRNLQIYFSHAEVSRLRRRLSDAAGRELSLTNVLHAHLIDVLRRFHDEPHPDQLLMPVDVRHRLGLPSGVVGNLTGDMFVPCPPDRAPEAVAADIRAALDDFVGSHLNLRALHDFLVEHRTRMKECLQVGLELLPRQKYAVVNSWTGAGLYDISFGTHRPVCVSQSSLPFPWMVLVTEGFDRTGYLCTVGVAADVAERLASEDGRAALHRFREPGDVLPDLAGAVANLL